MGTALLPTETSVFGAPERCGLQLGNSKMRRKEQTLPGHRTLTPAPSQLGAPAVLIAAGWIELHLQASFFVQCLFFLSKEGALGASLPWPRAGCQPPVLAPQAPCTWVTTSLLCVGSMCHPLSFQTPNP